MDTFNDPNYPLSAVTGLSQQFQSLGGQSFSGNNNLCVDNFYKVLQSQVGVWLDSTYKNATYNQMYNDGKFLDLELTDRNKKMEYASSKAYGQVRNVNRESALLDWNAGWYSFLSSIVRMVMFASAVSCVFVTLMFMGIIPLKTLQIVLGVFWGLFLLILIGVTLINAGRRMNKWEKYYWKPIGSSV
jgi:hypothetical protein